MASGSYSSKRNWRTACGRTRRFYVKTQASPDGLWLVAASADTAEQLAAGIERVRARHPERALRIDTYARDGSRIEGDRQEPVAAAPRAA